MPVFDHEGTSYRNPVELAMDKLGGRWKMPIIWRLRKRVWRFGELLSDMHGISHKMLTQQLRQLESDGFITRTVYAEVPPKVEYSLTDHGRRAIPAIEAIRDFGIYLKDLSSSDAQ